MNHQALMRVLHGRADLRERPQALGDRERCAPRNTASIAIAVDQFHHEVGHAVFGRAAIEQARDVGMISEARICRSCESAPR